MLGFAATVTMPDIDDPNAVLTDLAIKHMHPAFVALFVGAILSAIMSTSDSILLGVSSIISTNLLPLVRKDPSQKLRLQVARYAIPACGLVATYIAFNASRVVEVLIESAAVLLAAILVPFVLCFWWDKANRSGALAGMAGGIIAWAGAAAYGTDVPPDLIGFVVSLGSMVMVTLFTQKIDPPRPLTDIDGNRVEATDRLGTLPLFGQSSIRE
jgi:sodium/proline symporter